MSKGVSHKTKHPAPIDVIQIAGSNFGLRGMISALTGPPKSGKTTVIGYILSTCFAHPSDPKESLNVLSSFAKGRDVVYLDFEQHVSSTQDLHDKVLRYAGLEEKPDNLHILNLLEYTLDQRRDAILTCFEKLDLHLIVVDGLADVLTSVNDEEKSNQLIDELSILASKHNACVLVVIHENKGGGSVRGHLGSQIERKCAGLLSIKKNREQKMHSIESRLIRVGDDFETQYFHWSDEHKRMVLADDVTTESLKKEAAEQQTDKGVAQVLEAMNDITQMEYPILLARLKEIEPGASERTYERKVESAVAHGYLTKEGKGKKAIYSKTTHILPTSDLPDFKPDQDPNKPTPF
ncbi:AAA family ATPase [Fibrella aquatilis]|uniref:AAA family ATPase n=1 Tax=Fibrella aquatilis TaxID=2817059 RepID=A0A939GC90_9BACT|nr:AAA family ATPase [Fibrella aquatilis]MBO0934589.1 AAA family ATPase [Fibrella aquatilis]